MYDIFLLFSLLLLLLLIILIIDGSSHVNYLAKQKHSFRILTEINENKSILTLKFGLLFLFNSFWWNDCFLLFRTYFLSFIKAIKTIHKRQSKNIGKNIFIVESSLILIWYWWWLQNQQIIVWNQKEETNRWRKYMMRVYTRTQMTPWNLFDF